MVGKYNFYTLIKSNALFMLETEYRFLLKEITLPVSRAGSSFESNLTLEKS